MKRYVILLVMCCCVIATGSFSSNVIEATATYYTWEPEYHECAICARVCQIENDFGNIITLCTENVSEWDYRISSRDGNQLTIGLDCWLCVDCMRQYGTRLQEQIQKAYESELMRCREKEDEARKISLESRRINDVSGLKEKIAAKQGELKALQEKLLERSTK